MRPAWPRRLEPAPPPEELGDEEADDEGAGQIPPAVAAAEGPLLQGIPGVGITVLAVVREIILAFQAAHDPFGHGFETIPGQERVVDRVVHLVADHHHVGVELADQGRVH